MVFNVVSTLFQLYRSSQCTYPCFPGVLLTSTLHNILSRPLAAFLIIAKTRDSCEGEMNPVARNIINIQKEYWLSRTWNQQPPVLKSGTLMTELWGSAITLMKMAFKNIVNKEENAAKQHNIKPNNSVFQ